MSTRDPNTEVWAIRAYTMLMIFAERGDDLSNEKIKEFSSNLLALAPEDLEITGSINLIAGIAEMQNRSAK